MNCLSVFDNFVGLTLKGLTRILQNCRKLMETANPYVKIFIKKFWPSRKSCGKKFFLIESRKIYGTHNIAQLFVKRETPNLRP